ncbi:hypothetical protein acsn021_29080 [Anaerocolumna cellulosilytica]|uniref:Uncharacterized protein n=1 Tax=Anaerocolumna cellulosilytica TaxID=433286 RepID=A0A6S6R1X7_9FIRM|nr:hypothetical protein [Anaerocolumna cellulosilytica]MBB5197126.1 hypothetical protein [Anaerocolumna cellulosilytica]BCJ95339.1 hypothetical protein acsn021_29080 [Anaerocolumna cellulosilytica]
MLIAINEDERSIIHDMFDNFIVLLLEKDNALNMTGCNTYKEFVDDMVEYIC